MLISRLYEKLIAISQEWTSFTFTIEFHKVFRPHTLCRPCPTQHTWGNASPRAPLLPPSLQPRLFISKFKVNTKRHHVVKWCRKPPLLPAVTLSVKGTLLENAYLHYDPATLNSISNPEVCAIKKLPKQVHPTLIFFFPLQQRDSSQAFCYMPRMS